MLSVNRILIFALICIFSSSLYAVDVSSFDIKGIKLGMSKNEVLKRMPCDNPKIDFTKTSNNTISSGMLNCYNGHFIVVYDHNNYVYQISKKITFNTEPNLNKIKNKLIKRYGKPNKSTKKHTMSKNSARGKIIAFCWGSYCKVKYENTKYWKGSEIENWTNRLQLTVEYLNMYDGAGFHSHYLNLLLIDGNRKLSNDKWEDKQNEIYEKQQKEKESNIDF